jgi:transposase
MMRGTDGASGSLFSYVDLEARVPARHPLRKIRQVVNEALASLDAEFEALYTDFGRPSIAPERLIRASLIQILFSVRSERQLMEQMQYNLLFRWFVGLGIDDPVWVPTVFTKNRDRLLTTEMSRKVMAAILAHREVAPLLSDDHFSVDGTLVKAWASMKSFQPKAGDTPPDGDPGSPPGPDTTAEDHPKPTEPETDAMPRPSRQNRNAEVDFRGEKRSNVTHASTTDPDARLYKKSPGTGAMLCFIGHALMENRSGLIVQGDLTQADGHAERRAALDMIHRHSPGSTRQGYRIWPMTDFAKSSDHPARLRFRETGSLGRAFRRMLRVSFRRMLRFSGPLSFRLRARSSSKLMSSTQCRLFSIDQWARTAFAKASGVSLAEET